MTIVLSFGSTDCENRSPRSLSRPRRRRRHLRATSQVRIKIFTVAPRRTVLTVHLSCKGHGMTTLLRPRSLEFPLYRGLDAHVPNRPCCLRPISRTCGSQRLILCLFGLYQLDGGRWPLRPAIGQGIFALPRRPCHDQRMDLTAKSLGSFLAQQGRITRHFRNTTERMTQDLRDSRDRLRVEV